jgi:hypothetical protein
LPERVESRPEDASAGSEPLPLPWHHPRHRPAIIWLAVRRHPTPVRRVTASLELRRGEPIAAPHEIQNTALTPTGSSRRGSEFPETPCSSWPSSRWPTRSETTRRGSLERTDRPRERKGCHRWPRDAGLGREGLYKALSEDGNPSLATVFKVARVLGVRGHWVHALVISGSGRRAEVRTFVSCWVPKVTWNPISEQERLGFSVVLGRIGP